MPCNSLHFNLTILITNFLILFWVFFFFLQSSRRPDFNKLEKKTSVYLPIAFFALFRMRNIPTTSFQLHCIAIATFISYLFYFSCSFYTHTKHSSVCGSILSNKYLTPCHSAADTCFVFISVVFAFVVIVSLLSDNRHQY